MKGLLLTMTEPAPEMEEEFNAWYDTEHMHERLSIPGFISARRWVDPDAPAGTGKYLATYELENLGVLGTPGYLAYVGDNFTPWSKRCLARCVMFRRWASEQIFPGDALPDPAAKAQFLVLCDTPDEHEAEFNRWYNEEHLPLMLKFPGILGARRFRASDGQPRYFTLYDLADAGVPERIDWRSTMNTQWAQKVAAFANVRDWQLRCYGTYIPSPRLRGEG